MFNCTDASVQRHSTKEDHGECHSSIGGEARRFTYTFDQLALNQTVANLIHRPTSRIVSAQGLLPANGDSIVTS